MKIGILTQPLFVNYGGLLQAYALQTVLKQMGHDAWIVRRTYPSLNPSVKVSVKYVLRNAIKRILGYSSYHLSQKERYVLSQKTIPFINKYITPYTKNLYSNKELIKEANLQKFDAWVVGSDQVWRPCYSPYIQNFFLDFVEDNRTKRISYAASFGVDYWEYTSQMTLLCSSLVQKFDGVSVREDSAVKLCHDYLKVDAVHVLDPTMLLERSDYENLARIEQEKKNDGDLFCYILDRSNENERTIERIAHSVGLIPFEIMPLPATRKNIKGHIEACITPSVTCWIQSFVDAKMVITDSFHGCVFSIIFNKPFWVIPNNKRGKSRFYSLLRMFGLENRLLNIDEMSVQDFSASIDWNRVNARKTELQAVSINFLKKYL